MILFNFAHPLADEHIKAVEKLTKQKIERIISASTQFDNGSEFTPQLDSLMENVTLTSAEWQNEAILVNLPAFNSIAALILAEFHGRMGYFPPVLRMRPVANSSPPQYEVAEVLDLRSVRDEARKDRR